MSSIFIDGLMYGRASASPQATALRPRTNWQGTPSLEGQQADSNAQRGVGRFNRAARRGSEAGNGPDSVNCLWNHDGLTINHVSVEEFAVFHPEHI
jgi:hypothetical protein